MSLADDLDSAAPAARVKVCHACRNLADMPEGRDRDTLARYLTARKPDGRFAMGAHRLSRIARANGLTLPESDVRDHRNEGHPA